MPNPTPDPDNRPPASRWPDQTPPRPRGPRIEYAYDENGLPRRSLLVAYDAADRPVGAAARVAGSVPEQWVCHQFGTGSYETGLSEAAARAVLQEWAGIHGG